jgi:hypothetical protein
VTCVYALVSPAPPRLRATGVTGESLRIVTFAGVSVVVGEVRRSPRPSPANLRRYAASVQQLFEQAAAVLPARFGTTVRDPDELEFILRSRRTALRAALRHVRDRAQMTLRVVVAVADDTSSETPPSPRSGTDYLRLRAAEAARARAVAGFEPVRLAVDRWLRDERVGKQAGIATVYHLVPRGSVHAYAAAVERAAAGAGLRVVISGPWPPYAFASW